MVSSHDSLENFYETNFSLVYSYNLHLSEIEGMMPWERDVFILLARNKKQKEERQ